MGKTWRGYWRRRAFFIAVILPVAAVYLLARQNLFNEDEWKVVKERYRLFEQAVDRQGPDDGTLGRAAEALSRREGIFFHGKYERTLDAIGEAWAIVEGRPWDRSARAFWSLDIDLPRRLSSTALSGGIGARLRRVVAPRVEPGEPHSCRVSVLGRKGLVGKVQTLQPGARGAGSAGFRIQIPENLREGAYTIEAEMREGTEVVGVLRARFYIAHRLSERLASLDDALGAAREEGAVDLDDAVASYRGAIDLLRAEARGRRSDYGGDLLGLLRTLEIGAVVLGKGKDPYPRMHGDVLRTFVLDGGKHVPARVYHPRKSAEGETVPLIVALHGWKDNEHKFFEFNGAGILRRLAGEREILVVSPRASSLGSGGEALLALIDHLEKAYPTIDPDRIYLLAHSWGVHQAMAAAGHRPERFSGIALFAGSPSTDSLKAIPGVPLFVSCGTRDGRALGGCREMASAAKAIGHEPFLYEEVEGLGHVEVIWRHAGTAIDWMESRANR